MLHVGLDLSRKRVDVCLISSETGLIDRFRAPARFVHDELVGHGWEVLVADAQKVKGLAPLACKPDKIDARVLAALSFRDLVTAVWLPSPELRAERELVRYRLHLVKHRGILKNRIHSSLIALGITARCLTCSGWPAASCWTAWSSASRGRATSAPAWSWSTISITGSTRSPGD
jgi:transposase